MGRTVRDRAARAEGMDEVRAAIEAMFASLGQSHFALVPSEAVASGGDPPGDGGSVGGGGAGFRHRAGGGVGWRGGPGSPPDRGGAH